MAQEKAKPAATTDNKKAKSQTEDAEPKFDPSRKSIIPKTTLRAWELNPYQVLVWVCHDGSPRLNSIYPKIQQGILRRSELADPSGWMVYVQQPPASWRNRLRRSIESPEQFTEIHELPELVNADKLVVVAMNDSQGKYHVRVREYDVQTQQWGAIVRRESAQGEDLDRSVFDAISKAFMPIARVDRIGAQGKVYMRARAVNSCIHAVQNDDGTWVYEALTSSPVWIRKNDRFLPVIRRVDRNGLLAKLEPIDSTFLTMTARKVVTN